MATNTYTETVTNNVLVLMQDRGMNPTSLANASGVNRRAIEDGLLGTRDWKTSHLDAIARALNCDLATLVNPGRPIKASA